MSLNNRYSKCQYRLALLTFILLFLSLLCSACNNNNTSQNALENAVDNIASLFNSGDSIDVPLYLNPYHKYEFYFDTADPYDHFIYSFKVEKETEESIQIDNEPVYYDSYTSSHRFRVPKVVWFEYPYAENLSLQIDVVNNKSFPLDIEDLIVVVEKSKPDTIPLVFICTEEMNSGAISFYNGSWFNWGGFTFNYSILRKGERFNGKYKSTRHIDYFKKDTVINLIPDLIKRGYNFKRICQLDSKLDEVPFDVKAYNKLCDPDFDFRIPEVVDDKDITYWGYVRDYKDITLCGISRFVKSKKEAAKLFYPFEIVFDDVEAIGNLTEEDAYSMEINDMEAYATLYGNITFDNTNFSVDFIARVSLKGMCGRGAGGWENDGFDIMLRENDSNYLLRMPYTTIIAPNATEMVKLTVKAPVSSNHKMHIFLNNGNNLNIRSKDILLHYLLPPQNE